MFKYAQVDETGRCVSVSFLYSQESNPNLIPLSDSQDVQPGDMRNGAGWTRPAPTPPQPSEVDVLKEEIAFLRERDARMQDDISSIIEGLTGGV